MKSVPFLIIFISTTFFYNSTSKSFSEITLESKSWVKDVAQYRISLKRGQQKALKVWCDQAKKTSARMKQYGNHIDVGLGIDVKSNKTYRKTHFSDNPMWNSIIAEEYLKCFETSHACTGVKHFPGIGQLSADPHSKSAVEVQDTKSLKDADLKPFYSSINAGACTVMVSHSKVKLSENRIEICSFNPDCIALIRKGLNYDGLIVTDELMYMAAAHEPLLDQQFDRFRMLEPKLAATWSTLSASNKISELSKLLIAERCPKDKTCPKEIMTEINDLITDEAGYYRNLAALKAGNDILLQFRFPEKTKSLVPGMTELIKRLLLTAQNDSTLTANINASSLRILKRKELIFKKKLFKKFPQFKNIEDLHNSLSLEQKIKQMIFIWGWNNYPHTADELELGGFYTLSLNVLYKEKKTTIPLLRIVDHYFKGGYRKWGQSIIKGKPLTTRDLSK